MKNLLLACTATVLVTTAAHAALTKGSPAFTKRVETALLAEPRAMAPAVAKVGYARQLTIEEVRGLWLRVSEGKNTGWVFSGNVAEAKPDETKGLDGLHIEAAKTSATAAARPLAPAAEEYANRHGRNNARDDINWLKKESDKVNAEAVDTYQRDTARGEYK